MGGGSITALLSNSDFRVEFEDLVKNPLGYVKEIPFYSFLRRKNHFWATTQVKNSNLCVEHRHPPIMPRV